MTRSGPQVPASLAAALTRQARHDARVLAANRATLAAGLLLFLFLLTIALDRLVELPTALRLALSLAALALPSLLLVGTLAQLWRRRDLEAVAGSVDDAMSGSRDVLRSTVNLSRRAAQEPGAVSAFFLEALTRRADELVARSVPARVKPWHPLPRRLLFAAGLVLLAAGLAAWPPMCMRLLARRFLDPLGNHPRASLIRIAVDQPLHQVLAEGSDLAVGVTLAGRVPADTRCMLRLERDGRTEHVLLAPRPGNQFAVALKGLNRPLAFRVEAGDGLSARYSVAVQPRPLLNELHVRYEYPRYTRLPPVTGPLRYRELKAVAGTRARLEFVSTLPVRNGFAQFPGRRYDLRWDKARTHGSFQFTMEIDGAFSVVLEADSGTDNRTDPPFRVQIVPDNPPTVSLTGLPEHLVFFRDDILPLAYRGSDDFGIEELFIRFRSGDSRQARSWSLDLPRAGLKEVQGNASVELRQLTEENDARAEIELVMVDTKGQEAATPRVELQIVSDTADRQLAELIGLEAVYLERLDGLRERLAGAASRLDILLEGMNADTRLETKRRDMFDGVTRELAGVSPEGVAFADRYRTFPYVEYPFISQRQAEEAMSMPMLLWSGADWQRLAAAAAAAAAPKTALSALRDQVKAQAALAGELDDGLADVLLETRLRLIDCLGEDYRRVRERDAAAPIKGDAALALAARQAERLNRILAEQAAIAKRHRDALAAAAPQAVERLAAVAQAALQSEDQRVAAVTAALQALGTELGTGPALDGRLGQRSYAAGAKLTPAALAAQAAVPEQRARVRDYAFGLLRLRRDNPVLNDAELFLAARLHQSLLLNDPARVAAAAAAWTQLQPWSMHYDLSNRARLLQSAIRRVLLDTGVERWRIDSAASDRAWQDLRELYLSLMMDAGQGRFAGLSTDADLHTLAGDAALFRPWSAQRALGPPGALARLARTGATLTALLQRQAEPLGRAAALETDALLRDLLDGLTADQALVQQECIDITTETSQVARSREYRGKVMTEGEARTRFAANATPPRQLFSRALCDRLAARATALQKVADLRAAPWYATPTPAGREPVLAAAALCELFSHYEEEVYEKGLQPYLLQNTQGARPYPEFVIAVGEYYTALKPDLARLQRWLAAYAAGRAADVLGDAEFTGSLAKFRRQARWQATADGARKFAEFATTAAAAPDIATRTRLLQARAEAADGAFAYWEQLAWRLRQLAERTQSIGEIADAAHWPGLDAKLATDVGLAASEIARMLPPPAAARAETTALGEAMAELPRLLERSAQARVATLDAGARGLLLDDWKEWSGRVLAGRRSLDLLLVLPRVKSGPRTRYTERFRMDLMWIENLLIRGETRWTERLADARRMATSTQAWALAGGDDAPGLPELAWLAWQEEAARRKTAASLAQAARALNYDVGGVDERFLRMPKYLYEELERATRKPYPTDFRAPGTEYIHQLVRDAR